MSLAIYPSLRLNLARAFYMHAFFYKIQTVHFSGALKKVVYMPLSRDRYPRKGTAQYGLLSVFL